MGKSSACSNCPADGVDPTTAIVNPVLLPPGPTIRQGSLSWLEIDLARPAAGTMPDVVWIRPPDLIKLQIFITDAVVGGLAGTVQIRVTHDAIVLHVSYRKV
ncbi:MAG: hypothetical protein ACREQM_16995 [Candidatus Dormibacteraceae bacterium]